MTVNKRDILKLLAGGVGSALLARTAAGENSAAAHADHEMPATWYGKEQIAFLIYPRFTALDMVGPHHMLASLMGSTTMIVAKTRDHVSSDQGLTFIPSHTFEDCPADLDIICVPGGAEGTLAAMKDDQTIAFLKDRGARAKHVTSVCTGSLVLGAAGLLTGYKATSHWVARDLLKEFGAEPVDARVVVDRNRITAAGVTAGLDFGLSLVGKLRDRQYGEGLQLLAEYAPSPEFNAGTPATASPEVRDMMAAMFTKFVEDVKATAAEIKRRH